MSNMSYCRFANTAADLADCQGALEDLYGTGGEDTARALSREELDSAHRLLGHAIDMLRLVAENAGIDLERDYGLEELEYKLMSILEAANQAAQS